MLKGVRFSNSFFFDKRVFGEKSVLLREVKQERVKKCEKYRKKF